MNVLWDCNIFDKAEELSDLNTDIFKNNYVSIKNLRSRYVNFVVGHCCVHVCDRAPSRMQLKTMREFGLHGGTWCIAMSLTSLIFAHRNNDISSSNQSSNPPLHELLMQISKHYKLTIKNY